MPRKLTKTVYSFAEMIELNKQGVVGDRVIEKIKNEIREGETQYNWWVGVYEKWTDILGKMGFNNVDIRFSGFGSQGDGASFTAGVDLVKFINYITNPPPANPDGWWELDEFHAYHPEFRRIGRLDNYLETSVSREYHSNYVHERTADFDCRIDSYRRGYDKFEKLVDDFVKVGESLRYNLCRAIYNDLEGEYEYLTSDEYIAETAEANEWYYDIAGNREDVDEEERE